MECLEELKTILEHSGALGRALERLGEFGGSLGEFQRVSEQL